MENYQVQFRDLLKRAVSEPGTISAAYSAFHAYSIGNQLAALFQCSLRKIPVGPISTLKDWNSKGRFVKRGEKAIWLCMPITGKKTAKDETTGQETTEHYTFFVWKPRWFVLAQNKHRWLVINVEDPKTPRYRVWFRFSLSARDEWYAKLIALTKPSPVRS
jgi:N-terminal domain of anti-restriction factor ArdC